MIIGFLEVDPSLVHFIYESKEDCLYKAGMPLDGL